MIGYVSLCFGQGGMLECVAYDMKHITEKVLEKKFLFSSEINHPLSLS